MTTTQIPRSKQIPLALWKLLLNSLDAQLLFFKRVQQEAQVEQLQKLIALLPMFPDGPMTLSWTILGHPSSPSPQQSEKNKPAASPGAAPSPAPRASPKGTSAASLPAKTHTANKAKASPRAAKNKPATASSPRSKKA